jgi:hypothetical protein
MDPSCGPAFGELELFDHPSWCANGAAIQMDDSFQSLYEQQFGSLFFSVLALELWSLICPPGVHQGGG